jgi:L-seryl-tRNA(Ser) seleniumtransferase
MLATAACVTRGDQDKVRRLPDTTGMKNEVIIPRAHRMGFDHAARAVGVRLVEVDNVAELESAINSNTAMLFFVNISESKGPIGRKEFVRAGKDAGIPVFNDAAAELPPAENLSRIVQEGFDLVCFSGGKGIRGPQASGILMGRKDLIEAAHQNNNPHADTLGRAAKVGKEEIMALLVAVETYVKRDHDEDQRLWRVFLSRIAKAVKGIPTVVAETYVPPERAFPFLRVKWDQDRMGLSYLECKQLLSDGDPRIEVNADPQEGLSIAPLNLCPGEDRIVGLRLGEVLREASDEPPRPSSRS